MLKQTVSVAALSIFSASLFSATNGGTVFPTPLDLDTVPFNEATVDCNNASVALEGKFLFQGGNAAAYFMVSSGFMYFEYWADVLFWEGIAATNQTVDGLKNECLMCLEANGKDVSQCLVECVNDNQFVVTGRGDSDPDDDWETVEFKIDEMTLPLLLSPDAFYDGGHEFGPRCIGQICKDYIHVWWHREYSNSDGDAFNFDLENRDDICFTWITSACNEPFIGLIGVGNTVWDYGVVCPNHTQVCPPEFQTTPKPTPSETTFMPTVSPTPSPTIPSIPELDLTVPLDVCNARNLSLIILLDASASITDDSYELAKDWVLHLMGDTEETLRRTENTLNNDSDVEINLCLRTSVITFSTSAQLIWNLDNFGDCYDHAAATLIMDNLGRPHNETSRLRATHTKDAVTMSTTKVLPTTRDSEGILIVMLTDGLPSSVNNDASQNPCLLPVNNNSLALDQYDARFLVVGVESQSVINVGPFECLFTPYDAQDSLITTPDYLSLTEVSPSVHNTVFETFCEVSQYQCDFALYPNVFNKTFEDSSWPLATYPTDNMTLSVAGQVQGYQFTIEGDQSRSVFFDTLSTLIYNYCPSTQGVVNATARIWQMNGTLTGFPKLLCYSDEISVPPYDFDPIAGTVGPVFNFTFAQVVLGQEMLMRAGVQYQVEYLFTGDYLQCLDAIKIPTVNIPQGVVPYALDDYLVAVWPKYNTPSQGEVPSDKLRNEAVVMSLCLVERIIDFTPGPTPPPTRHITCPPTTTTTMAPTMSPTPAPTYQCPEPDEYFPMHGLEMCAPEEAEWRVTLTKYKYYGHKEVTLFKYLACTMQTNPAPDACNPGPIPEELLAVTLQLPCACEVCLPEMTSMMEPHGHGSDKTWTWMWSDLHVAAGCCRPLELWFEGYIPRVDGLVFAEGANRHSVASISVPKICDMQPMVPKMYRDRDAYEDCTEGREHPYHSEFCRYNCEFEEMEYRVELVSHQYDAGSDKTMFIYEVETLSQLPQVFCTFAMSAMPMIQLDLRLPCGCDPASDNFLTTLTESLRPRGYISSNRYSWPSQNIEVNRTQKYRVELKGNVPSAMGDFTIGGHGNRCGSGQIAVPNPCADDCLYGQWTPWNYIGVCDKLCGGGHVKRQRDCVSVCDGITPVDNCLGTGSQMMPCNTQCCDQWPHHSLQPPADGGHSAVWRQWASSSSDSSSSSTRQKAWTHGSHSWMHSSSDSSSSSSSS